MKVPASGAPAFLRGEIASMERMLSLMKQKLAAFRGLGIAHRTFYRDLAAHIDIDGFIESDHYLKAHKANEDAEAQLMENEIAQLEGQLTVHRAWLQKAEALEMNAQPSSLIVPGRKN